MEIKNKQGNLKWTVASVKEKGDVRAYPAVWAPRPKSGAI
jgi:hypothetical protein